MRTYISYLLLAFGCLLISDDACAESAPAEGSANHIISHTFQSNEKTYAILDDFSIWVFNPEQMKEDQNHKDLVDEFITIMPDTGPSEYPVTFVIGERVKSYTMNQMAIPAAGLALTQVDASGEFAYIGSEEEQELIHILPDDTKTIQAWKIGQKLIVGGVWFPEYDPQERSDCGFIYTLYNYETKEFVRFNYL